MDTKLKLSEHMGMTWFKEIDIIHTPIFKVLLKKIKHEYDVPDYTIVPRKNDVFKVLRLLNPENVKVIIVGQDPYPQADYACGIAFGTNLDVYPRTLKNIHLEINKSFKLNYPIEIGIKDKTLEFLVKQGVLLIHAYWTTQEGETGKHTPTNGYRWDIFTNSVIRTVLKYNSEVPIIALGKEARSCIPSSKNIYYYNHPSNLSFKKTNTLLGSGIFKRINKLLQSQGKTSIKWLQL